METKLLELHAAEIMNVGGVAFHFLEREFDLGLRQNVLLVDPNNSRALFEFSSAAAPARPNTKPQVIDRQRWRGNDVEDADQRVHAVELATHIFAKHAALQIGKDRFSRFHLNKTAHQEDYQNQAEYDPINRKRRETATPNPLHEPGNNAQGDDE